MRLFTSLLVMLLPGSVLADSSTHAPTAELFFGFDSARLDQTASDRLAPVIAYAKEHPNAKIILDGHTDPVGQHTYNVKLSLRRAEVVRDRLARAGIDDHQVVIGIYGEDGVQRTTHAADRRVTIWTSDAPIKVIVDHTLVRGTAAVWTKPVEATALLPASDSDIAI